MQQPYRRTPVPKCNFNKIVRQFYGNDASAWVFSYKFAVYFQKTFSLEHLWRTGSSRYSQFVQFSYMNISHFIRLPFELLLNYILGGLVT